jgi:hypothetical protein
MHNLDEYNDTIFAYLQSVIQQVLTHSIRVLLMFLMAN